MIIQYPKKFRFLGGNTMNKLSQFNSFVLLSKQEIIASFNEYSDFFITGRGRVFCNREVHSFATKNTQCCHPIVSV